MKQSMLRKGTAVVLAAVLAFSLSGCGGSETETGAAGGTETATAGEEGTAEKAVSDVKVGISFGTLQQEMRVQEKDLMVQYAEELGYQTLVQGADNDEAKQTTQCENLITQGIDVLVIYPINSITAAEIVDMAHEADVPVINYATAILNSDQDLIAGHDLYEIGKAYAEYLVEIVPEGNYLILNGDPSWYASSAQKNGIHDVLDPLVESGDITIVGEYDCTGFDTDVAMQYTESALTATNNDIDAIVCIYDGMAQGAIAALEEQGLAGQIPITGQDAELAACQRIVEGTQSMTIYKPTNELARKTMEAALQLALGEEVETTATMNAEGVDNIPLIDAPFEIITKDNMYDVIIKGGYHTLEEVYANVPQDQWPTE